MTRKLYLLLVTLLACGFIAAGCGDDDDDGGGSDEPAQEQTGGSGTGDVDVSDEATKQAIEDCKQSVAAATNLSDTVKDELNTLCGEAAGDVNAAREAAKRVCIAIIDETVPEGPARDTAKQSCEQATDTN